ncbi:MAG: ATP-binding cassette domain-containing protein [Tranquillimonas sp.]
MNALTPIDRDGSHRGPVRPDPLPEAEGVLPPGTALRGESAVIHYAPDRLHPVAQVVAANTPLDDPTLPHLLAMMCQICAPQAQVKQLLGAIPAAPDTPPSEALLATMANLGFEARRRAARPRKLRRIWGVALFCPAAGAPVLLFDGTDGRRWAYDGQRPPREICPRLARAKGTVWGFRSSLQRLAASDDQRRHSGLGWVRALLRQMDGAVQTLVLTSLGLAAGTLLMPLLVAAFYQRVLGLGTLDPVPAFAVAGLLLLAAEAALMRLRVRTMAWTVNRLDYLVTTGVFGKLLSLSPQLSDRMTPQDQAARLRSFEGVRDFLSGAAALALLDLPVVPLGLLLLAFLAPPVFAVVAVGLSAMGLLIWLLFRRVRVLTSILADEATEMQRALVETFERRQTIRDIGLAGRWAGLQHRRVVRDRKAQAALQIAGAIGEATAGLIASLTMLGALAAMTRQVWDGSLAAGMLLAVLLVTLRVTLPLHALALSVPRLAQMRRSLDQIDTVMDLPSEGDKSASAHRPPALDGRVTLLNLGHRIADTRPVFFGLDTEIRPGEVVGVTGANGAGKSTLLRLIMGMTGASMGAVRLDGADLRQFAPGDLRRRIAYVPQAPRPLPGTVEQSLRLANPLASRAQLIEVARLVGLEGGEAPTGPAAGAALDRMIVDGATAPLTLRFRLAYAQALLINSKLLLLDEMPNELLDGPVGDLQRRLIEQARGRRTVVFATHRSDMLRRADRMIVLRYGKMARIAKPDQLDGDPT